MKNKLVLPALIIGIALVAVVYIVTNNSSKSVPFLTPTPTSVSLPSKVNQSPQDILQSLQQSISPNASIGVRKSIDWIDDNNQVVPLKGWDFGVGIAANNYMGSYGSFSDINEITEASLQPLQSAVESFFVKNGFTINSLNKRRVPPNQYGNYLYGYSLGDIKCLVRLSLKTDPFGNFFCGTIDNDELVWRRELEPVINSSNNPNLSVRVNKLVGNYATGTIGTGFVGSVWYAVKIDGQWKEVWTGQNIISCKPVQQYNIPKEIYVGPNGNSECSSNY